MVPPSLDVHGQQVQSEVLAFVVLLEQVVGDLSGEVGVAGLGGLAVGGTSHHLTSL